MGGLHLPGVRQRAACLNKVLDTHSLRGYAPGRNYLGGAPLTYQISQSAYAAWLRCEQKYDYAFVRRLRPRVASTAPQLGTVLHEYLAAYYRGLKATCTAQDAHSAAVATGIHNPEREREVNAYARILAFAGRTDEAREFDELIPRAERIAHRYYEARGREDAERYEVEMVEQALSVEAAPGVTSISIIDLVLLDRMTGYRHLVEHKSTTTVPPSSVRLRDFQTLLYAAVLERWGKPIDSVMWNYLRTKEPTVPEPLKKGGLTRRADIDTTWEVYLSALKENGIDPVFYEDMRDRLAPRELTVFFPRYRHDIVVAPDIILRDYATVAGRIRNARMRWQSGADVPVRSLTRDCDYCEFYRICEAVIVGGDEETAIDLNYTTPEQRKAPLDDVAPDLLAAP